MGNIMKTICLLTLFCCLPVLNSCSAQNSNAKTRSKPADGQATPNTEPAAKKADQKPLKLANPASVHCEQNGGKLKIMTGDGGQSGVCLFDDGTRCEEWRFFRKECAPGQCRKPSGLCR